MIGVHVLRNTMIPLVTVLGLELGSTIAFAVVTESIFSWPGAGKLILDSINALDRPVIVSYSRRRGVPVRHAQSHRGHPLQGA